MVSSLSPSDVPEGVPVHFYLDVIRRRLLLIILVFVLVVAAGILLIVLPEPVYRTSAKVLIPVTAVQKTGAAIDVNNPISALLQSLKPVSVAAQVEQIESEPFVQEAMKVAEVPDGMGVIQVDVDLPQDTDVLRISTIGAHPETLARLANAMANLHVERMEEIQTRSLEDAIRFVAQEQSKKGRELNVARERLRAFSARHPLAQLAVEQEGRVRQRTTLEAKRSDAQNAVVSTRAQIAKLKNLLDGETPYIMREETRANPQRALLETKLQELTLKRTELLQDFVPTAPEVQLLEELITNYQQELDKAPETVRARMPYLNSRRELLEEQLRSLEVALVSQQATARALGEGGVQPAASRAGGVAPLEIELEALTQVRNRLQSDFNVLSSRLQDLQIRRHARADLAQVIDRAQVPTSPIWPKPAMAMLVAVSLGLLLSFGVAFLQEHLDDRVNSERDVERVAGLPTLGWPPRVRTSEPTLLSELPRNSPVAEAYRAIRSSVNFAAIDAPIRRLQVTSASQGDGKTLTSVNLAIAMAMEGKQALLVDADLRRPQVHQCLGLPQEPGLSDLLAGTKEIDEVIRETAIPHLRVICSGALPENPAELLGSLQFEQLLQRLDRHADIVIFDAPACIAVTDAVVVGAQMDAVLLLAKAGHTRKAEIAHVVALMARARARVIGTLFMPPRRKATHYYHYYSAAPVGAPTPVPVRSRALEAGYAVVPSRAGDEYARVLCNPEALDEFLARGAAQLNGGVNERLMFLNRAVQRLQSLVFAAQAAGNETLERDLLRLLNEARQERADLDALHPSRRNAIVDFQNGAHETLHEREAAG